MILLLKDLHKLIDKVDRDTKNVMGAVDISKTIFEKIENSDVFVADVTIVAKYSKSLFMKPTKKIPNSNVMLELGYAVGKLGWDRIVLIFNEKYGKPDELPFDLRQHRLVTYKSNKKYVDKEKNNLIFNLKEIINEYYKKGPLLKNGFSFNKLVGYDFYSHTTKDKLIGYSIEQTLNFINLNNEICEKIKNISKQIGQCVVNPRISNDIDSPKNYFNIINSPNYENAEPYDLDHVITSLKCNFGIEYDTEYFSFGNLKISTTPYFLGNVCGPSFNGSDDEIRKRNLYCDLLNLIYDYDVLLNFKESLDGYLIYPIVAFNDSLVKDETIEFDISLENDIDLFDKSAFLSFLNQKDAVRLVSSGILTKLFYNYVVSDEIENESNPTDYPRVDFLGKEINETTESCADEFDNLVLNFLNGPRKKEAKVRLESLFVHEKKWTSKLLIVKHDANITLEYKVKSNKSDCNNKQIVSN